ncbi:MAG: tRNA (adenosine(37)-N6)-dimethylallyltransferase MiaA [Christensenellaceae bacterium]|jgi:tRNA dimethylallyltransferase|nr:tRNA (adenosine(37)-N6)-dimethylallyltransferase MiaA [Christensenellaceae bacterium]
MGKLPVGVLVGPTASGKTALSIGIAKALGAEIVSADSIQVYRGLDIGSAKPTAQDMEGVPHHMLSVAELTDAKFSVAEYKRQAEAAIVDIHARGRFPLVVGGTGLYVNALTTALNFAEVPPDEALRAELRRAEEAAPGKLYALLQAEDPACAQRLHPHDSKRIIRALEVVRRTGKPIGEHGVGFAQSSLSEAIPFRPIMAGLTLPRETLYARINARVDAMLQNGLEEEALSIYRQGCPPALPALQGLGYRQLFLYFGGACTRAEAIEAIKRETRHFAKRQITWFKRDARIRWFDVTQYAPQELRQRLCQLFKEEIAHG